MQPVLKQFQSKQFLLFLLTGGFAAGVNFFSRILYSHVLSFTAAVVCAYLTGMVVAYILAKLFVFQNSQNSLARSSFAFVLINLLAVVQTLGISLMLADVVLPRLNWLQFKQEIAHACGVIFPVFTSYLGHKYFSFK